MDVDPSQDFDLLWNPDWNPLETVNATTVAPEIAPKPVEDLPKPTELPIPQPQNPSDVAKQRKKRNFETEESSSPSTTTTKPAAAKMPEKRDEFFELNAQPSNSAINTEYVKVLQRFITVVASNEEAEQFAPSSIYDPKESKQKYLRSKSLISSDAVPLEFVM